MQPHSSNIIYYQLCETGVIKSMQMQGMCVAMLFSKIKMLETHQLHPS